MESQGGICHKRQVCKVEGDEVHHGCLVLKKQIVVNIRDIHNKRKQGSDQRPSVIC